MIDVPLDDSLIRGAVELERTDRGVLPHRLPALARARCTDPQLLMAESQPAGVRLELRTAATRLELDAVPTKREYVGAPPRPDGTYRAVVDGVVVGGGVVGGGVVRGGDVLAVDMTTGSFEHRPGPPGTLTLDLGAPSVGPQERDVELWLPHDETTVLVALRADAPVRPVEGSRPVWVHHGSSISHGSNATEPTATWPAVVARRRGLDLVNLGFGGGALLDPFTAQAVRDLPADLVSLKLGINLVNADLMRRRALGPAVHGFLDIVRDGHPTTPLLLVTPIWCGLHDTTPGPLAPDPAAFARGEVGWVATGDPAEVSAGRLTLQVVSEVLADVVTQRADDPHLHLVDGLALYDERDAARLPLPDGLHPDQETHSLLAERFGAVLERLALP